MFIFIPIVYFTSVLIYFACNILYFLLVHLYFFVYLRNCLYK